MIVQVIIYIYLQRHEKRAAGALDFAESKRLKHII